MTDSLPILEMRAITKRFPGLTALDSVDFAVSGGEMHALIGQNGAGKSTLMKVLAGVYPLDDGDGEIRIEGKPVRFAHPRDALRQGLGVVYQDLSLVPKLSVADNMFLGREMGSSIVIDEKAILQRAAEILAELGIRDIDARTRLGDLPLARQQLIEIAKVLSYNPRILVLDEPTAALAEDETALLFGILRGLRERGIAIIYISHRFKEILQQCDRATVLRNGKLVKTIDMRGVSEDELIELTIGERVEAFFHRESDAHSVGEVILEVDHLSVGRAVRDVSFTVRQGEIIGLTGLLGAGQNELARALFGILPEVSGVIRRSGQPVLITSPKAAIRLGIGLLTEHRKLEGIIPDLSIKENISLPSLRTFRRALGFIANRCESQAAQRFSDQLHIKAPSIATHVGTLSGGNQQKVILAKWLLRDLDLLIFIAPTQGIDVGAKAEIYQQLHELARQGKSVIVVSEDLIEILGVSDRILVMVRGQLTRTFSRGAVDEESLLSAIQGNTSRGGIMTDNALPVQRKVRRIISRNFVANNSTLLVLLALLLIFGLTSKNFLLPNNIFNIWRQMAVVGVLAIGMTLVILIGGIDLSVGSVLFLAGGVTGWLLQGGMSTPLAIAIGLGGATLVGLINGLLVEVAGISPVIATLGMLIGIRGLAQVIMSNAQIRVTDAFFSFIAVTRTPGIPSINLPGLPLVVIIVFVLYLVAAILMRQTLFGRYIYAIGGNEAAARLCGVPVKLIKILAYVICGFTAGIGGMLIVSSTGIVSPNLGVGSEFFTIAAVVLGGTRLSGGVGRVEKTLLGAMILYMVLNYMTLRHIPTEWQQAATGLLVLAAVVFDRLAQRGSRL